MRLDANVLNCKFKPKHQVQQHEQKIKEKVKQVQLQVADSKHQWTQMNTMSLKHVQSNDQRHQYGHNNAQWHGNAQDQSKLQDVKQCKHK